jgi:cell division protein ZapE
MTGPILRYRSLVQTGELISDPVQEFAVEQLQLLHHRLNDYDPIKDRGFLSFLNRPNKEHAPKGLYLFGDVGRGKSLLMDLFFEDAPTPLKRRVHFHAFMLEVHGAINAWRKLDPKERVKQPNYVKEAGDDPVAPVARGIAATSTLLCFDEFQVTDIADAMLLGRLFEHLFTEGVVVVLTSNRRPSALYENGINRPLFEPFIDLIKERLEVFQLNGPTDYRLDRLKGEAVYYVPLGAVSDAQMQAAWRKLTDCEKGAEETLEVQGRTLPVPQSAKGVARFHFSDLAAKALGAADYLTLAERYHTVLLDHIPCMTREKRNEAKRFVTLIDALYENHVRLVCSADGLPEELYPAGDGAFEFSRTASRLMEMQSADWWE